MPNSFQSYLTELPLKPLGAKVRYFNGALKANQWVAASVIDLDVGSRNLQQCADAVMRLRAEYLFKQNLYDQIHFNFTNGFCVDYSKWRTGFRIQVDGNNTVWVNKHEPDTSYTGFRNYMNLIFAYAGTLSLEKELIPINIKDIQIGDIFIHGGSPGHAVIVVDMAYNAYGEKIFLLAQSYMPAQDIHILNNPNNPELSPWYPVNYEDDLKTPEWIFKQSSLMRFKND